MVAADLSGVDDRCSPRAGRFLGTVRFVEELGRIRKIREHSRQSPHDTCHRQVVELFGSVLRSVIVAISQESGVGDRNAKENRALPKAPIV